MLTPINCRIIEEGEITSAHGDKGNSKVMTAFYLHPEKSVRFQKVRKRRVNLRRPRMLGAEEI